MKCSDLFEKDPVFKQVSSASEYFEKFEKAMDQACEIGTEPKVTCASCGRKAQVISSFRCAFCLMWFCDKCYKEHFGIRETETLEQRFKRLKNDL